MWVQGLVGGRVAGLVPGRPGGGGLVRPVWQGQGWVAWTLPAERWRGTRPGPRVLRARRRARAQKHAHADKKTLIWCCSLFFGKKTKKPIQNEKFGQIQPNQSFRVSFNAFACFSSQINDFHGPIKKISKNIHTQCCHH